MGIEGVLGRGEAAAMRRYFHKGRWGGEFSPDEVGSISRWMVMLCVVTFVGLKLLDPLGIINWFAALEVLGLSRVGVLDHFWIFQFITAPFVHASVVHLAFNMLALWTLGPAVERRLATGRYLAFSFACAFAGFGASMMLDHEGRLINLGYSSVIFGLLVAQATFFPDTPLIVFGFFPTRMKYAVIILGAIELYLIAWPENQGIAHAGHLAGAAVAWLLLRFWRREQANNSKGLQSIVRNLTRNRPGGGGVPSEL